MTGPSLAQRLQDVALKTAMLYALLEDAEQGDISVEQLNAGIAFAEWEAEAQKRLFEGFADSSQARLENNIKKHVRKAHDNNHKPKKRDVQRSVCGGGVTAFDWNRAFDALVRSDQLRCDPKTLELELLK